MDTEANSNTILIVDDAPQNLHMLVQVLAQRNYKVRTASNGVQALESARHEPPALILLDVMMPEMDGFNTCAQLKADPVTRDIPVIFLSARGQRKRQSRCIPGRRSRLYHQTLSTRGSSGADCNAPQATRGATATPGAKSAAGTGNRRTPTHRSTNSALARVRYGDSRCLHPGIHCQHRGNAFAASSELPTGHGVRMLRQRDPTGSRCRSRREFERPLCNRRTNSRNDD